MCPVSSGAINKWVCSALACVGAIALPTASPAQIRPATSPSAQAVIVLEVKGKVEIVRAGRRLTARAKDVLQPGDHLQTLANSHATLLWYGRMASQASELSDLSIPPPPSPQKRTVIEVLKGFIYFFHRDQPGQFEFRTPTASAVVLGTDFSVRVEENRTVLALFDGEVELSNPLGVVRFQSGEQGISELGQLPRVTPIVEAVNDLIQWFLYYPAVLDVDEAGLSPQEEQVLAESLAAYRSGDLPEALARYPAERQPVSDAEKIYFAALLLTVGQVEKTEALLATLTPGAQRPAALASGLRKLIATVKGQPDLSTPDPQLATSLLADSYYQQSRTNLAAALQAAASAARQAPRFGYAWARVAELQFSFGRTKEALAALQRALELSPRNAQALVLKGFLLSAQNNFSEAIVFFERAIDLDGGLGNGWLGRGLCRIRQGESEAGRQDLEVAAALEPQRSLLRSYLGKAFSNAGQSERARREIQLARQLDPRDPTGPFYGALLNQQNNRINEAVRDLEESQSLNDNRRLYRSRLLLDQDRAVRGANLATIYQDAGMTDVSVREAVRAVNADYANYSAHLFLANSFNQLRDPRQVNIRYETAWFSEFLVANLLAPVGAGTLSQRISEQEYSKLFERDRLGVVSSTEYGSRGDWSQAAVQYGHFGNSGYALDVSYRSENGQRPNADLDQLTTSLTLKQQLTPGDSVFVQGIYYDAESGDVAQYYDPTNAQAYRRIKESQEPILIAGYHREWAPWSHTLLLASRSQDTLRVTDPAQPVLALLRNGAEVTFVPEPPVPTASLHYRSDFEAYFAEVQQLFVAGDHSLIAGGRFQTGTFDTESRLGQSTLFRFGRSVPPLTTASYFSPEAATNFTTDFQRWSLYAYHHWQAAPPLLLTAGLSYDWLDYPENFQYPPTAPGQRSSERLSPKAGFIWTPWPHTTFRGAYTRSLGGVVFDQSFRLEPTQVGGFNQAFRSLIPESVAGTLAGPRFETWGLAWDQKIGRGTYFGAQGEWLRSKAQRNLGTIDLTNTDTVTFVSSLTPQRLDYEERNLLVTLNQLLGQHWAFGARYRLSEAELRSDLPEIADAVTPTARANQQAILHQLNLFALFNHESGFFSQADAIWSQQSNRGYSPDLPGDDFWQLNLFAGYRFPQRRAEVRLGLLNALDQDYRLNPLNLTTELPRRRTLTVSLKFSF